MSYDDLYTHEDGRVTDWSPFLPGKKQYCNLLRVIASIFCTVLIFTILVCFLFMITNSNIASIATDIDVNPLAMKWLPNDIVVFTFGIIILFSAFAIGVIFHFMKMERQMYMAIYIGIFAILACLVYSMLSQAVEATSVLFTSPGDPYYIRYYVGTELVREIGASNIYHYWLFVFMSCTGIIYYTVYAVRYFAMNKRFDTAASKKTFSIKESKTSDFTCTSIDGKDICKLNQ